jgi:hypothetical protein
MIKRIRQGDLLPLYYGTAWIEHQNYEVVCLPLGINVIAAVARSLYFSIRFAHLMVYSNPRDAYMQGVRDGRAENAEK